MRLPLFILFGFLAFSCHGNFVDDLIDNFFSDDSCFSREKGDLCQNNGTCIPDKHEFRCQCVNGWSGMLCDECPDGFIQDGFCDTIDSLICLNGGTCDVLDDRIQCICEKGFYGKNCEYEDETEAEMVATALKKVEDSIKDAGLEPFSIPPNAKIIVFRPSEPSTTLPTIEMPSESSTESSMSTIRAHRPASTETSVTETAKIVVSSTEPASEMPINDYITIKINQNPTSTTNQLYSLWPILLLVAVVIILIAVIALRRCIARKDVHINDEIPTYNAKGFPDNRPIPIVDTTLHDALKYSKTPLESIPDIWTPLLNAVDILGQTPIHAAVGAVAEKPETAIISDLQLLNASETNINQRDFAGNTPLHIAIKCRRPEVVAYLLFLGADPNAFGPKKMTPLSMAIVAESFECFEKLLEHKKIDPNVAIEPEDTPLKMCIARGEAYNKFFDALLRNPKTDVKAVGDIKTGISRAPIHVAVLAQNVYALNWLIKRNANLIAKDRAGKTPLLLAVEMESLEMAQILIPAMKTSDFYDANPECSPFEQAKLRNLREILEAMKNVELADIKPRKGSATPRLSVTSVKKLDLNASNSGNKPSPNMSIRRKVPPILPILSTVSSANLNNSYQHASPSMSQQSMPMPLNNSSYCQSFLNSSNITNSPRTSTTSTANSYQQPSPLPTFGAYRQQQSPLTVVNNNYQQTPLPYNRYNNIMSPYQTSGTY